MIQLLIISSPAVLWVLGWSLKAICQYQQERSEIKIKNTSVDGNQKSKMDAFTGNRTCDLIMLNGTLYHSSTKLHMSGDCPTSKTFNGTEWGNRRTYLFSISTFIFVPLYPHTLSSLPILSHRIHLTGFRVSTC